MEKEKVYGTYSYQVWLGPDTYETKKCHVEIISETEKSYKIKIPEFIRRNKPGDIISVRKRSVVVDGEEKRREVDTTQFWYNKD